MSLTGKIFLANDKPNIFSGDDISLIVEIECLEKVIVKEIFLNFRGEISVKWEDLISKPKDFKIIYFMQQFEGEQMLFNNHITVQAMDVINKQKYQYNVILNVPHQLPQSVSRKYGAVKYELELGVCYAAGVEVLCTMPLDIKQCLNVCHLKKYMRPFHTVFKKSLCLGICNIEPLKVTVTVPNTSFIPGDAINYFVKIENTSKLVKIQRISVILTQIHHYTALKPKERTKQVPTTLSQITHPFNETNHNAKIEGVMKLPHTLVPTSPQPCLINTSYNLHFILVFIGFLSDGFISLPIIVGNHKEATDRTKDFTKYETRLQIEYDSRTEYEV